MRKVLSLAILFFVMLSLLATSSPATAQDEPSMDPAAVLKAVYAAVEVGDLEAVADLLADDVVLALIPPPEGMDGVFVGKEAVLGWYEELFASNGRYEITDTTVMGNRATSKLKFWDDWFVAMGVAPAEFDGVNIAQNGKLKSITWVFTEEFITRFEAAITLEVNKALAERFMEDLWIKGDVAVADEILAEEFVSHAFPPGDREVFKGAVAGFHADHPKGAFIIHEQFVTPDRIVLRGSAMDVPESAAADAQPEPFDEWIVILAVKDGQITDRWFAQVPQ
jgi:hypothetical protein